MAARVVIPKEEPKPAGPKFEVIDKNLHAHTSTGEIVLPLRIKTKLIRAARDFKNGAGDELDQLVVILDALGDQKAIDQIDELDFIDETVPLVTEFFRAFGVQQSASLGESTASSN